jgi:predicted dinucleotide-binding enzyme
MMQITLSKAGFDPVIVGPLVRGKDFEPHRYEWLRTASVLQSARVTT